jgi:carboxyl-terminal processing protease
MMRMKWRGRTVLMMVLAAMVAGSVLTTFVTDRLHFRFVLGQQASPSIARETENIPEAFYKVVQSYQLIKSKYVSPVDDERLINGAINGMIGALDDPHTNYMDPKEAQEFQSSLESSFQGIGSEVSLENGKVTIVAPLKGSPAAKAGLRPKDQIISVNGESLEGLTLTEAVLKIRGPKGTEARLQIIRPGVDGILTIVVIRDDIPLETVYAEKIGEIGKIQVTQFSFNTAERFKEELANLEKRGIKGLLIDVRGNPGGLLDSVVEIGQSIIPQERVIVKVEYRDGSQEQYSSKLKSKKYPIVVLADGGSASAAEILTAALQQSGFSVVGQTTYGKGTVQNPFEMKDGSEIKLTIAKWLAPNGTWINKKGITPDLAIKQPAYFEASPVAPKETLKPEMNNAEVANLQVILDGLGFSPGRTDGYYSKQTKTAVETFQRIHNLPATGEVDQKTGELITDAIRKKIEDPANDLQMQAAINLLRKQIAEH